MLFYMIFGTNLLTQSPVPISVFPCFRVLQKRKIKRSPIDLKLHGTYFWSRRSPQDLECTSGDLRGGHEAGGHAHPPWGTPGAAQDHCVPSVPEKISKKFPVNWTPFDFPFLRYSKTRENRKWHWALG